MKVEKVMINGKEYYRFRECENIQNRCARCCFSKGCRGDLPFTCESNSYYVRPEDCPVKIANATINVDLPAPPEVGEVGKETGEKAAAEQQQLTERNEERKLGIGKRSYYGFPNGVEAEDICRYLSFNLGNLHSELVAAMLDKDGIAVRAGYHCSYLAHKNYKTSEKGTVRASAGIFNSKKDVKNLVNCLNKIAKDKNLC